MDECPKPDATAACTASPSRRSWSARGCRTCALYEARGLLEPERTDGGTRRYSADDLDRLRRIGDLLGAGLNLAGIAMVIDLQDRTPNSARKRRSGRNWSRYPERVTLRRCTIRVRVRPVNASVRRHRSA